MLNRPRRDSPRDSDPDPYLAAAQNVMIKIAAEMGLFLYGLEKRNHANEVMRAGTWGANGVLCLTTISNVLKDALKNGQDEGGGLSRPMESGWNFLYRVIHILCASGVQTLCGILRLHTSTGASSAHRTGGARTHTHTWMEGFICDLWILVRCSVDESHATGFIKGKDM